MAERISCEVIFEDVLGMLSVLDFFIKIILQYVMDFLHVGGLVVFRRRFFRVWRSILGRRFFRVWRSIL